MRDIDRFTMNYVLRGIITHAVPDRYPDLQQQEIDGWSKTNWPGGVFNPGWIGDTMAGGKLLEAHDYDPAKVLPTLRRIRSMCKKPAHERLADAFIQIALSFGLPDSQVKP